MNFTREPLIETVITPKDGYKLVVRSSKGASQEEFFVDAVEVICFGKASFFRSLEKPKCFLVPISDYEILEVRESRMVLKTTGSERGIKIGGGRETLLKVQKEETLPIQEAEAAAVVEQRVDKKKERRRSRKRRGKGDQEGESIEMQEIVPLAGEVKEKKAEKPSLIPPPSTLISETLMARLKAQQPISDEHEERHLEPKSNGEPQSWNEEEEVPF